jgi:hypothetical protein
MMITLVQRSYITKHRAERQRDHVGVKRRLPVGYIKCIKTGGVDLKNTQFNLFFASKGIKKALVLSEVEI